MYIIDQFIVHNMHTTSISTHVRTIVLFIITQMKLKKILDIDTLQGYRIISPTKEVKQLFPKKYTFVIFFNNRSMFGNVDAIPQQFFFMPISGYIFTYASSLPDILKSNQYRKYDDYGHVHPFGLDQYFVSSNDSKLICDIVISCTATNAVVPVQFVDPLIIRCNSKQLVNNEEKDISKMSMHLKNNIEKIINQTLKSNNIPDIATWLHMIMNNCPLNDNDMPFRYPSIITESLFKSKSVKLNSSNISFGYDFRAENYEFESSFIHAFEKAFTNGKRKVVIYDTYNRLLSKIIDEFDKKGYKYTYADNHAIEVMLSDLWSLDIDYEITDFI